MKTTTVQQEILLNMASNYLSGQYAAKDPNGNAHTLTQREQLEEACWNGYLPVLLPEIFDAAGNNKPLYLWQIIEGENFLNLTLGETPDEVEKEFSINPYSFLSRQLFS
ncbi:MAG: hypothetical protein JNL51_18755 [Chitinophagaceae bacterium]|nr:hypothetical protein [Chitinophagaceae bacterium]